MSRTSGTIAARMRMMTAIALTTLVSCLAVAFEGTGISVPCRKSAVEIGSQPQLFLDDSLIESFRGAQLELQRPRIAEIVLHKDRPWEDDTMYDPVVVRDGSRFRMWYRTNLSTAPYYTGYAESGDGIHWTKPSLGLITFRGSQDNNLVWETDADRSRGCALCVFKDDNPAAPQAERYKAIGAAGRRCDTILGMVSPDGLRWRLLQSGPIIPLPTSGGERGIHFDSHNIAFRDGVRNQYVAYLRGWKDHVRSIRRSVSADFRHWSNPEFIDLGGGPAEHLYKNAATPYYRRPDIYLMFPKRFLEQRQWDPQWPAPGISDIVFMTSRDGLHWDRRFREAFIRPGTDSLNWHERAIEVGPGLVPTGSGEMSFYMFEHYHTDSVRIRRCVLREDGLVSLHAGATEGEISTRPLIYQGNRLELNLATSAAGSVRVEIQDPEGKPVPGFELAQCREIYGDQLSRVVRWGDQANVGLRAGKAVRLRFVLRDADLFSFRFTR